MLKRSGGVCEITGKQPISIHHIIYRSHGGITDRRNMIAVWTGMHIPVIHADEKYWVPVLLDMMRGIYGIIDRQDLKKKNKWTSVFTEEEL